MVCRSDDSGIIGLKATDQRQIKTIYSMITKKGELTATQNPSAL